MKSMNMPIHHLLIMAGMHFIAMYILMYAMVDTFGNVFLNLNNGYMAAMMTAPMLLMEGMMMRSMYENKKALYGVMAGSAVVMVLAFLFIRMQTAITDKEFLRSMIPHHAGAILMCEKAQLSDPELRTLCESIISSQQSEIDSMKRKLNELDGK